MNIGVDEPSGHLVVGIIVSFFLGCSHHLLKILACWLHNRWRALEPTLSDVSFTLFHLKCDLGPQLGHILVVLARLGGDGSW